MIFARLAKLGENPCLSIHYTNNLIRLNTIKSIAGPPFEINITWLSNFSFFNSSYITLFYDSLILLSRLVIEFSLTPKLIILYKSYITGGDAHSDIYMKEMG